MMSKLFAPGESGVHQAAGFLNHSSPGVRRAALRIFQGSHCKVLTVLPGIDKDIGALLEDTDFRVRGVAALALCHLGAEAAMPFASSLLKMLQSVEAAELRDVLAALASLGGNAFWAAEAVLDCLLAEQWSVRRAAAETFSQIAGRSFEAQNDEMAATREAATRLSKLLKDMRVDEYICLQFIP